MLNSDFGPDGTQAPPPPPLFPDPLAGLVTADARFDAPLWTPYGPASSTSRVVVPTPPVPTEESRQAIWAAMERERRRPRGRAQQPPRQYGLAAQTPAVQPQQAVPKKSGLGAVIGCLVVLGFFVLVIINILSSIFSG